jgi:hypothetical protein
MGKNLRQIFQNETEVGYKELSNSTYFKIIKLERRRNIFNVSCLLSLLLVSVASLIPVWTSLQASFASSGFYEYSSIVFSNWHNAGAYWKEISLALAESLPIDQILYTLALVFLSVFFIRLLSKNLKGFYHYQYK